MRNPNKGDLSRRCKSCTLRGGLPYVLGEGDGNRLIIIGEAPGRIERATGSPFVGRAGQLLRGLLNQLELDPSDIRITNVAKCRPPNNRAPTPREMEFCLPHLYEEISQRSSARLLLLGNTALHALTDCKIGITRARGEWFEAYDQREALATFHPSYIRRPAGERYFATFAMDLQRSLAGPIEFVETEWKLLDSADKVNRYFDALFASKTPVLLAWDLETSGYRFYENYILAMSLSHKPGKGWVIPEELIRHDRAVHDILLRAFDRPNLHWLGHSAKFDQIFTLHHIGNYPKLHADTMMMHLALDERKGTHDLKTLARDLCGAPDWEAILWSFLDNREDTYAKVPRDVLYRYAAHDADFTLQVLHIFEEGLNEEGKGVQRLHKELLLPASEAMMWAEYNGVCIDIDEVDQWQCKLEDELEEDAAELNDEVKSFAREKINERLRAHFVDPARFWDTPLPKKLRIKWNSSYNHYEVADKKVLSTLAELIRIRNTSELQRLITWRVKMVESEFSANSWQKVGTLVYDVLGLEYLSGRDARIRGKEYSTSSASLEPYKNEHKTIDMILGYRTKRKLKSTYVDGLHPDTSYRVHPRWKMHASVTGRIGCIDPNLMNIPHEAGTRDFFIASPEHVLIHADYSQAELRILAAYSSQGLSPEKVDENFLVRCYRDGKDLHTEITVTLFGEEWGYDERMIAKAYNFGLVYGRSAKSIAEAFDIPLSEAMAQKQAFFERMPQVHAYLKTLEDAVFLHGELQNAFGRKRRFHYVDHSNLHDLQRQAKNFMMQSTASDCCLMATTRISQWFREIGWGHVLIFIHDSVVVEVPEAAMKIAARKLHDTLLAVPSEYLGDDVPFKVDIGVGYSWGQLYDYDPEKGEIID